MITAIILLILGLCIERFYSPRLDFNMHDRYIKLYYTAKRGARNVKTFYF